MSDAAITIWVERKFGEEWREVNVQVDYEYSPAEPPSKDRTYPGRPEYLEILSTSLPLDELETKLAENDCWHDVRRRQKEARSE